MNESASAPWRPALGAWPEAGGVRFRVGRRTAARSSVVVQGREVRARLSSAIGTGTGDVRPGPGAGGALPVPAGWRGAVPRPRVALSAARGARAVSRRRPGSYVWSDRGWTGVELADLVVYELHVGTFTSDGTFRAPGSSSGSCGISASPPSSSCRSPTSRGDATGATTGSTCSRPRASTGARRPAPLVDAAHDEGLAVLLDVVYNHLGPDGYYLGLSAPPTSPTPRDALGGGGQLRRAGLRACPGVRHRERAALAPRVPPRRAAPRRVPRPGRRGSPRTSWPSSRRGSARRSRSGRCC